MIIPAAQSPNELQLAFQSFQRDYPAYSRTRSIDELRACEYARLDRSDRTYLDYTGASQYAHAQLRRHLELLQDIVWGNPHSGGARAPGSGEHIARARAAVRAHFQAAPGEYRVVFTPNASGALKHVGECYPFAPGGRLLLTFDNHNSVNGIREFARARGAEVTYVPLDAANLRVDPGAVRAELGRGNREAARLFAFPAQSNFSGVQHPLDMVEMAHEWGWDVLLDAAAFVPTNPLDLGRVKADFISISFYKMFGYPTGIGCLLVRDEAWDRLRRPWFAGGTVGVASIQADTFARMPFEEGFEDGTPNFLDLPAVEIGLRHMSRVGVDLIHERVQCLTGWLLDRMSALRHRSGVPLVRVHGPADLESRGGCIAFTLLDPAGAPADITRVEDLAREAGISLRTGCFCNPGAGETAFGLTREQLEPLFQDGDGRSFDDFRAMLRDRHGKDVGAVRVSLGIVSNFADVFRLESFLRSFLDRPVEQIGAPAPADRDVRKVNAA